MTKVDTQLSITSGKEVEEEDNHGNTGALLGTTYRNHNHLQHAARTKDCNANPGGTAVS